MGESEIKASARCKKNAVLQIRLRPEVTLWQDYPGFSQAQTTRITSRARHAASAKPREFCHDNNRSVRGNFLSWAERPVVNPVQQHAVHQKQR